VVITLSLRTPLAKSFKGGMKDTEMDYVLYTLLKEVLGKSKVDPALIEDVCLGNVSIRWTQTQTEHSFTVLTPNRSATAKPPTSCAPPLWPQESRTRPAGHR
jgi:acetyl-CoA acetyltransferase